MARRKAGDGGWTPPPDWPSWSKRCGAKNSQGIPCRSWAIRGMPTCRMHGSGGERNRELGMIRYMCWVITGGPQNMPIEMACTVALFVFAEAVINKGKGTPQQMMKAALWLTDSLE